MSAKQYGFIMLYWYIISFRNNLLLAILTNRISILCSQFADYNLILN